ncbi:Proteasome activator complex subunit [Apis cerana cerana]|uniref:Proteasome activator complex subunit n=1 Tax=Apis cerana cerana TaxID=94128 RepID=A0A2A3EQA9_APICC|nr:Proteasome activator complex subunit [Apis cerana cerana]
MNKDLAHICIYKSIEDVHFKKFIYNKLLPYVDDLEIESKTLLAEIKSNLARAVMFNETWPGCFVWVNKLCHYLNIYGLHFSKEDHILLIKLLYELVTLSEIPTPSTFKCLLALLLLLKKKKLISPDELELPWQPLYKMILCIMKTKENRLDMYHFCSFYENAMESLIICAKLSATQEILDELRPTLCLVDVLTMSKSIQLLRWFLPVQLSPKHHSIGYKLWFEEFMTLWEICHNSLTWESKMMELMAALANHNIGYINWEPYIPLMFTRFIRCLKLPVSYNKIQRYKHHEIDACFIASWIVAVLGNGSSAQTYLDKFLKTIETYFHPANNGCWLGMLKDILLKLSSYFITRLHKERYAKRTWETPIPEEYKLTDNDVNAFVKSMMPVTMVAMFNKLSVNDASQALQYLATMRPNLVIPYVLDRVSSTLDSLTTESYKLIATLSCMDAIARPMAEGSKNVNKDYTYPEGPRHILPLLSLLLSSIDPSNPEKCFLAFRLISVYACLIPIVNTSKSITSIDEEDEEGRMDYETASGFEDFVLQFLDKIFSFIDHSSLELVRLENSTGGEKSKLEKVTEHVLYNVCMVLLMQINDEIFKKALDKLCTFITERILEIEVAGQLAAGLCRVFARVNGKETVRTLLPILSQTILDITGESNDITKDEHLDDRLLHAMLLLSAIVHTTGNNLLHYIDTLITILDRVVILKSREGNNLGCILLKAILHSLSNMVPYHFTSTERIRYWGQILDINALKVKWYIPGKEEIAAINQIFIKYLIPETNKLEKYCNDWTTLTREELLTSLNIVYSIIEGCDSVLPMCEGKPLNLVKSSLKWLPFRPTLGMKHEILMPDGSNVKYYIGTLVSKLQNVILKNTEGDTKSLFVLIKIWGYLLLGTVCFSKVNKNVENSHRMMKDMLVRKKGIMGSFVLARAEVQHVTRSHSQIFNLTEIHKEIMLKLFTLATSRYAGVRWQAQNVLVQAFLYLPFSCRIIIPKLLDVLREDPEADHDAYEGALHVLLDSQDTFTKHDWNILRDLWTTMVLSKPSEKLSIIRLKEDIARFISKQFSTIAITFKIPNTCLEIATALWKTNSQTTLSQPTEDERIESLKIAQAFNECNLASYNGLISDLLNALLEKNLHWRHRLMAIDFIRLLVHPEQMYPPKVIRYFLGTLIHDSLNERNIALRIVICMLQQQKRQHPKITIDPPISSEKENQSMKCILGQRSDNTWLQYNYETRPLCAEQWDEPRFIHEAYLGFYTWPKKILMYAPTSQQPCLDPNVRKLTDYEKEIDLFFNDSQNIEKLIKFYSLETKKDKDKFSYYKYRLFKGLFRNHGIIFLKKLLPHLHELVKDKQESSQRCAAEIVAGIIKGSKHWPFNMVCEMWDSLLPIIKLVLINMTPETLADWVLCFSTAQQHRDPNRQHWLLECLMEEICVSESESSFIESGRLFILQTALAKQPWRVLELLQRLLKRIEDRLLANPFENMRERLSSILVTVFTNLKTSNISNNKSVSQIQDFINKIVPKLQPLIDENAMKFNKEIQQKNLSSQISIVELNDLKKIEINEEERERAIRLLKTICKWIVNMNCAWYGLPPELYQIFPIIYQMENCEIDEELRKSCTSALTVYAQAFTLPCNMPIALEAIEKMSKHISWWTRSACLEFLQAWVFYNMCTLLSNPAWVSFIKNIVLRLLEDERVEVRKNAGKVLSGLVHCMFIPEQECLLDEFKKKAKTKLYKKEGLNYKEEIKKKLKTDALRIRHAAIIGMCAFVQANPYDIPKYVPPIFEHLRAHMNDPQPIPVTIKKTLDDFKRTHNGWKDVEEYTQHFTEEQLTVLQDLIMPPSYYA